MHRDSFDSMTNGELVPSMWSQIAFALDNAALYRLDSMQYASWLHCAQNWKRHLLPNVLSLEVSKAIAYLAALLDESRVLDPFLGCMHPKQVAYHEQQ